MSLDSTKSPSAPGAAPLQRFADIFASTLEGQEDGLLVQISPTDTGFDVATALLEGRPPADVLLGTVAPEKCWAMGVCAHGWVRAMGHGGSAGPRIGRAGMVVLVDREGQVASRLDFDGEQVTETPAYGATLDCLQRAFGLPTAPPREPAGLAFAQQWLGDVIAVSERRQQRLAWREIAALHPACQLLAAAGDDASTDFLEAAGALGRVVDWELMRWMTVEGKFPAAGLSGADAAWLDAGSFSRWLLSGYPGVPELLDRIGTVAGVATARRCARALRQLGLLTRGAWRPPPGG